MRTLQMREHTGMIATLTTNYPLISHVRCPQLDWMLVGRRSVVCLKSGCLSLVALQDDECFIVGGRLAQAPSIDQPEQRRTRGHW